MEASASVFLCVSLGETKTLERLPSPSIILSLSKGRLPSSI